MTEFYLIISCLYMCVSAGKGLILGGLFRKAPEESAEHPAISILIAAKNEEKKILRLLTSLEKLDYPEEKFEVIVADDNSTDSTNQITKEFIKEKKNYLLIKPGEKAYPAKRGALQACIEKALYDCFLITDADCEVERGWLKRMGGGFRKGADFIFGPAPFKQTSGSINKISCYENFRSGLLNLFLLKAGLPFSAPARNFGFSRKAFEKSGGYGKTLQTLSGDDDLLLREAYRNRLSVHYVPGMESGVKSDSTETLKEYISQRSRHIKTSFHYLPRHIAALGVWHLLNLAMVISPVFVFLSWWCIIPAIIKSGIDVLFSSRFAGEWGYRFSMREAVLLSFSYEFFIVVNFFSSIFHQPEWKEFRG